MQDDSSAQEPRNPAVSQKVSEDGTSGPKAGDAGGKTGPQNAESPAETTSRSDQRAERQKRRQEQMDQRRQAASNAAKRKANAASGTRNKPKVSYKDVRAQAAANASTEKKADPEIRFVARDAAQRSASADARKAPVAEPEGAARSSEAGTVESDAPKAQTRSAAPVDADALAKKPAGPDTAADTRTAKADAKQDKDEAKPVTTAKQSQPKPDAAKTPKAAPAKKPGGGGKPAPQPAVVQIKPQAGPARARGRHIILLMTFLMMVVAPVIVGTYYLFAIAVDQYHSTVGFSVRKEESNTPVELLGGITNLSGSSTSDTDILYEFIQSQEMVEAVDEKLDLRAIWSKPDFDPVFAIDADISIEDLMSYWRRMVRISYDGGTGLIELRVLAFEPQDAQDVAREVFEESSRMINEISAIARQDATRYAEDELEKSVQRLKDARLAITEFRSRTQIVDPTTDLQGQMSLLANLQGQLAEALIEMDLLRETTREGDPRITQAQRRIDVIGVRIDEERKKIGVSGSDSEGRDYATLFSEYERLSVDREFAEQSYIAALTAYDGAISEAQRQSRYLAAYVQPTKAQTSQYPQKEMLAALLAMFCFLIWAILVLIYYSIRDRR